MIRKEMTLSVIIPVYNVSAYIERCIKSVMGQTNPCRECIIVDDASPDDSIAKCEKLFASYKGPIQFSVLHHNETRGLSAARNSGTATAIGDYILYLDSDDELTPDCLEKLTVPVENDPTIEMVIGNYEMIPDGYPVPPVLPRKLKETDIVSIEAVRDYYYSNKLWVTAWNKLIRRDFLEKNQLSFIEGILYEDKPWTFHVLKHLSHLHVVPDVTYLYYKRPLSITTGMGEEEIAYHQALVYKEITTHFTPGEEAKEASYFVRGFCSLYLHNSNRKKLDGIIPLFKQALSDGHHAWEKTLLCIFVTLSNSAAGRGLLSIALAVRRFFKSMLSVSSLT